MNAVEIEEAISKLAGEPFDPKNFPVKAKSDEYTKKIYKAYRCALYHSGATDGAFRVFVAFLVEIRKSDEKLLRRNFKKR